MDSKTMNVMIIIILTLVFILVPIIMKKVLWKKLLVQLNNEQYDEFYKTLDTGICKFSYQAFNREYMRLSGYLAQRNDTKIEEQLVSSDIIGMRYGSLFDATQTMAHSLGDGTTHVQVVSWYDNENSYTSQMVRTIKYFSELA